MENIKEILKDKFKIDDFLQENKNLVKYVLKSIYPSIIGTYEEEDFIQEGMWGLFEAMKKFDENKNINFSTFAFICIRSSILKKMKTNRHKIKMYDKNVISIYTNVCKDDAEGLKIIDLLKDKTNVENCITDNTWNNKVINHLNEKLKGKHKIVFKYLLEKKSQAEIARILGCSREWIRQHVNKIKNEAEKFRKKAERSCA